MSDEGCTVTYGLFTMYDNKIETLAEIESENETDNETKTET